MWRSRQKKAPQGKKSRKPAKPTKRLKPATINRELACLKHLYNRNAVLALGIAFEALLSETNPSLSEFSENDLRFLHRNRRNAPRVTSCSRKNTTRPGVPSRTEQGSSIDAPFVRNMAKDVRDVFRTIASLTNEQKVESEDAYARMFDAMKWGAHPVVTGA